MSICRFVFLEFMEQILLLFTAYPMLSRPPRLSPQPTRGDFSVLEPAGLAQP